MTSICLSLLVLLVNSRAAVPVCPERCLCHNGLVDCRRQSWHSVPHHLPKDTVVLDLRNNRLMRIARNDLRNLDNLQLLLLSSNRIRILEKVFSPFSLSHQHTKFCLRRMRGGQKCLFTFLHQEMGRAKCSPASSNHREAVSKTRQQWYQL